MIKKHKYWTISILLVTVIVLGSGVPWYLNSIGQTIPDTGSNTSQPETSQFIPPISKPDYQSRAIEPFPESELLNCTYPIHYWQDKPEAWPAEVSIGGLLLTKESVRDIYLIEEPDSHTQLIQHVYTAFLNILNGADIVSIETTLLNAERWMEDNPPETQLSEFNLRQGRDMTQILIHFNNGEIGPGACSDAPKLPDPTPVPTAMLQKDIPEVIGRPQESSNDPPTSSQPVQAAAQPVQEIIPTDPPPLPPPSPTDPPPPPPPTPTDPPTVAQPTNTPVPSPTDTPPPPPTNTPVPSPTNTLPPPPTNTPVPLPTDTPPPAPTVTPEPPDQHPQGLELANKFGVSYEEIIGWHAQGFGFGEIDRAYELSQDTGTPAATIFEMRASGMGWGQIRKALSP